MAECNFGIGRQRVEKILSEFLNAEEINHEEYAALSVNSTSKLLAYFKTVVLDVCTPSCSHSSNIQLESESPKADIEERLRYHLRAYIYSFRKCEKNENSETWKIEFENAFGVLDNKTYQCLNVVVHALFDKRFHMRAHYFFITNRAILKILDSIDMDASAVIPLIRPWLNSPKVLESLFAYEESELFSNQFANYMKMAQELNCPHLCESLFPIIPFGKFANFKKHEKDERILMLILSENITIKLRENIAVAIDIIIPKKVKLKRKGDYIYFKPDSPHAQMAHYGSFWLGAISKFRVLTKEERETILAETGSVKHLQVHFNISMKFWWAVKLLGVVSEDHIYISYSTLWYYFQNHQGLQDDGKYDNVVWKADEGKYVPIEECGYRVRGLRDETISI